MTTEYFYVCDVCGQRFEDEYECERHEFNHKFEGMEANDLKFYASNGIEITLEKLVDFDEVYYVEAKTEKAAVALVDIYLESGGSYRDADVFDVGKFYYDIDTENWKNVEDLFAKYKEVCEVFE